MNPMSGSIVRSRSGGRGGFTLVETLLVMALLGVLAATAAPAISAAISSNRIRQAANLVANDLGRAYTIAGRARQPVRIIFDDAALAYQVVNPATNTVIAARNFGADSEQPLTTLNSSIAEVDVFPNGFASAELTVTITVPGYTREIKMTRTGKIQVSGS